MMTLLLLTPITVDVAPNMALGSSGESGGVVIADLKTDTAYTGDVRFHVQLTGINSQETSGVYLLLDGRSSPSIQDPPAPLTFPVVAEWDTTEVSNGWHTIQALASYPTGRNEDGGYEEYTGQVVRVRTFNPIIFEEALKTFGTNNTGIPFAFPIRATSSIATTQWKVTISTLSNRVVRVLTGATANGAIETNWDGNDANGSRVNESIDIEVETIPPNDKSKSGEH